MRQGCIGISFQQSENMIPGTLTCQLAKRQKLIRTYINIMHYIMFSFSILQRMLKRGTAQKGDASGERHQCTSISVCQLVCSCGYKCIFVYMCAYSIMQFAQVSQPAAKRKRHALIRGCCLWPVTT